MPSPGNSVRVAIERALRVLTLFLLAFAAWSATRPPVEQEWETSGRTELAEALQRWTAAAPQRAHLTFETAPSGEERDWLRALRYSGTPVTWDGDDIPPLGLEVAPVANPRGGSILWIAAPAGTRLPVADAVAPIDTVVATNGGARVFAPITTGALTAMVGAHRVDATARDTVLPRRVLVVGRATWESKFVISALEETGWPIDARLSVAPGIEVTQGTSRLPDTARHAAAIILDPPSASTAAAVARYVRGGGGAILAGGSASGASLAEIAAGRTGARIRASSIAFADDTPRRALGFLAIAPRTDAIVLEERDGRVAAAARRVDAGRVVQVGYDETWRWRLAGGAQALDAHRMWWSALVSSVAYRATVPLTGGGREDDAPLAHLVDALGPPTRAPSLGSTGAAWSPSPALLFAIMSALLLAELGSRRLRGAP
jgi:hypothetical protein